MRLLARSEGFLSDGTNFKRMSRVAEDSQQSRHGVTTKGWHIRDFRAK